MEIIPEYNEKLDKWRVKYRTRGLGSFLGRLLTFRWTRKSEWQYLMVPVVTIETSEVSSAIYKETHYEIGMFNSRQEAELAILRFLARPTEYEQMEEGTWKEVAAYHTKKR